MDFDHAHVDLPTLQRRAYNHRWAQSGEGVIPLTAADSDLSRAKGRHAGVAAYLTKPFVADKVVVIAEKLVGERRLLREREAMQRYLSASAAEAAAAAADAER